MPRTVFEIPDFGAVPGALATGAIQAALDAAGAQGGGRVVVPPGTWTTGTLHLRSFVTLDLATGATLLGAGDIADYPASDEDRRGDRHRHHLISARGVEHVTITGGGTIDGNGPAFWKPQTAARTWIGAQSPRVSPMIDVADSSDVRLIDVNIVNSPGWTVHFLRCDRVWVRGVHLRNHLFGPNTDGFDVNACRDVMISDSRIECGDDAIVLKTTQDAGRPCERVTVTGCTIRTNCVGLKCGTESHFDMRQIAFANCVVEKSTRAFGLYARDGGTLEDIAVTGLVSDTDGGFVLNRPLTIILGKRTPESRPGRVRGVLIGDVIARTDGRMLFVGSDGLAIEDLTLRNVQMIYPAIDDPAATAAGAKSSQFAGNASLETKAARAAIVADGVRNFVLDGLQVRWPEGDAPPEGWAGLKCENGSDRRYESDADGWPDFSVAYLANVRGGRVACPLARPYGDADKYVLRESEVRTDA